MNKPTKIFVKENDEGRFYIEDEAGDGFYNEDGELRTYTKAHGASKALKNMAEKFPTVSWIVLMPGGKEVKLGMALADEFDVCDFSKVNLVTQQDSTGYYDLLRCDYCGHEHKGYGISYNKNPWRLCPERPK